eukprot:TRINITY_DN27236_c0_g1_i1.p1 TRINITY_DN27236_c0_g1~~TRINITY_DN27236_c0_g1_i1.p1  ORF type:complete len:362 (+),score=110.03 TRINITY_DN27236_c0_g1_i1:74-1087(+)
MQGPQRAQQRWLVDDIVAAAAAEPPGGGATRDAVLRQLRHQIAAGAAADRSPAAEPAAQREEAPAPGIGAHDLRALQLATEAVPLLRGTPGGSPGGRRRSATPTEEPELLEARERAHRLAVDLISQRNLVNLLTERIAEQAREADTLRARIAAGTGSLGLQRLAESLSCTERELARERARGAALEHELALLRSEAERMATAVQPVRTVREWEGEVAQLRARADEQARALAAADKGPLVLPATLGAYAAPAAETGDAAEIAGLRTEAALLRAKLRDKTKVAQELQNMLRMHLERNSELRTRALLHRPEWTHPLLKGPIPTTPDAAEAVAALPASGLPG